jgi:hypothetical protein
MMTKVFSLILLICIAASFQCNSSEIKKTGEVKKTTEYVNPYFPVTEGNYWIYISDGDNDETELLTVKAKDTKKTENGYQVKMTSFPYLTKENNEQSLVVKPNGEIEALNYFGVTGMFIPAPENFKNGYEWQYGIYKGYIRNDTSTVETQTGKFTNCYYVMMTEGFTFSFEMWYKKDVGIVKWGANRTNPPTFKPVYYFLKDYKVN